MKMHDNCKDCIYKSYCKKCLDENMINTRVWCHTFRRLLDKKYVENLKEFINKNEV